MQYDSTNYLFFLHFLAPSIGVGSLINHPIGLAPLGIITPGIYGGSLLGNNAGYSVSYYSTPSVGYTYRYESVF
jgi:hypothetical protein